MHDGKYQSYILPMGDDLQMIQPSSNLPVRVILALSEQLTTKLTEKKHKGEIRVSAGA